MLKTWRNNFEWGEGGEVSLLSHRPVASSDLKQDTLFFREIVSTFLKLVVAYAERCSSVTTVLLYKELRLYPEAFYRSYTWRILAAFN